MSFRACRRPGARQLQSCAIHVGVPSTSSQVCVHESARLGALLLCGNPPKEICDAITMMCEDAPLLLCLL